jgi:hypothetical protein
MRTLAALAAGAAAAAAVLVPATASGAPAQERPPECQTVQLIAPSGHFAWLVMCGAGAGQESPLQGFVGQPRYRRQIMDGTRRIDPADCPKANPCVLIAVNSPQS